MSKQLSACSYVTLTMINTFIGLIASYSLGLFHGYLEQIDTAMRRLDSSKQNRFAVLEYKKIKLFTTDHQLS